MVPVFCSALWDFFLGSEHSSGLDGFYNRVSPYNSGLPDQCPAY